MIRLALQLMAIVLGAFGLWIMASRLGEELHAPDLPASSSGAAGDSAPAVISALPEFAAPPFEHFTDLLSAPIFFASRRMPQPSVAPPKRQEPAPARVETPSMETLQLQGVMIAGGKRRAFLRIKGQAPKWFDQGDAVIGWRITRISPKFVVLRRNGREARINLYQR